MRLLLPGRNGALVRRVRVGEGERERGEMGERREERRERREGRGEKGEDSRADKMGGGDLVL